MQVEPDDDPGELRLFLEEVMVGLCRRRHVVEQGIDPDAIAVTREIQLGGSGAYADIRVDLPGQSSYFVEVKHGVPAGEIVARVAYKLARHGDAAGCGLIVIVGDVDDATAADLQAGLAAALPTMSVEVWHERRLIGEIDRHLGVRLDTIAGADLLQLRDVFIAAEWRHAFATEDVRLSQTLLWHFGPWTLRRLHQAGLQPTDVMRPGNYRDLVILMADLCSFSSYVRDTRDDAVVRRVLTAFYSQARHAVHEAGGMLYQFVGDEVVGVFGLPRPHAGDASAALRCARQLVDIGNSISEHWQRRLDRVQRSRGLHIGIARGDLNLMPLRAFSRRHMGFVGDSINMAARLMAVAGPGEVVVSNGFHRSLPPVERQALHELPPVEAKNIGLIKCWRLSDLPAEGGAPP